MNDDLLERFRRVEAESGGALSVAAARLDGSDPIRYRDDSVVPAASTIKIFLLLALLDRVAAGEARLADERVLRAEDRVPGTGVLKVLEPGRAYPLRDLAMLMIVVSDNTATNLLIDAVGLPAVEALVARHGWTDTVLTGKLQTDLDRPRSTTSARDLADALARLWRGELLPERETAFAREVLERQQDTALGRELGYDAYATETGESDLRIASKNGAVRGVRNDAGVIRRGANGFVVAVTTTEGPDPRFHPDNPALRAIGRATRLVAERLLPPVDAPDA